MVITMTKLHTSTHGARKPPGPKKRKLVITMASANATSGDARKAAWAKRLKVGNNSGQ